jgi:uridine phosphorylase|tara:strand:+ start:101 stop:994 length:894 start_codon:yes stop_codon:yes gene_type:complete
MKGNLNESKLALEESELVVNEDGSIFHLHLLPHQIADTVLIVGDQGRVKQISQHFSEIEHVVENREFVTHTGIYKGKRISALSTGIGADNIDIVLNELDALVNIDLKTRKIKPNPISLTIIRIGTSGALQPDIPVDSYVVSEYGLGFDGLAGFYNTLSESDELEIEKAFFSQVNWSIANVKPYIAKGDETLIQLLSEKARTGITVTGNGFYGPQGRVLRVKTKQENLNEQMTQFNFNELKIMNFEMETSALYSLGGMMGHKTATICAIIANRHLKQYSEDYKKTVDEMILYVLSKIS